MKIGIVNDLPIVVEALRRVLALRPQYEVCWVAHNGNEAVDLCARETPDVVLMDIVMPGMDGVEATRRIVARMPCAVLIVTVSVSANASRVFEAMGWGAIDAIDMPVLGIASIEEAAAPLLTKIDSIAKLIGRDHLSAAGMRNKDTPREPARLLAIGSSAGGPAALATLLGGLPADFSAGIVIIQHVDKRFVPSMAEWLSEKSALPVRAAIEGDRVTSGSVLLAATNDHLVLKGAHRLGYTAEPRADVYRPSVDVFFHSVVRHWTGEVIGVLLTGMGTDGALGLKALRGKGCLTIAQDRSSSAVYGMPKAAAALDAAVEIIALNRIAPRLCEIFQSTENSME